MGKRGHICINIIGMHEDRKQFISIVNKQCIHKLGKTLYVPTYKYIQEKSPYTYLLHTKYF